MNEAAFDAGATVGHIWATLLTNVERGTTAYVTVRSRAFFAGGSECIKQGWWNENDADDFHSGFVAAMNFDKNGKPL